MTYSLARFKSKPADDRPIVDLVQDTFRTTMMAGTLALMVKKKREKEKKNDMAQKAMLALINNMAQAEQPVEDTETGKGLLAGVLGKALKFVGKRIIKTVLWHTLKFAGRIAMSLLRFAARALLRYIIVPVVSTVVTFIVANPISLAIGAVLGGIGYFIWDKFFNKPSVAPKVSTVAEDTSNIAEEAIDIEAGAVARVELPGVSLPEKQVYEKSVSDYAMAPVEAVRRFIAPTAAPEKKGGKFAGFGEDVDAYIKEASQRYPILPEDVFRGFVKMEAGWTGKMSPTGAIGTGQFIQGTWDSLAATPEGKALGMTKIGKRFRTAEDPRFDKRINTLATGLLASQNAEMLKKSGLPITGENLYMMHNIGPGIIPVMLGQPASEKTLLAMRQNGMLKNQNAADFLAYQKGRFNVAYQAANTYSAVQPTKTMVAEAVKVDAKPKAVAVVKPQQSGSSAVKVAAADRQLIRGPGGTLVKV